MKDPWLSTRPRWNQKRRIPVPGLARNDPFRKVVAKERRNVPVRNFSTREAAIAFLMVSDQMEYKVLVQIQNTLVGFWFLPESQQQANDAAAVPHIVNACGEQRLDSDLPDQYDPFDNICSL